MQCGKRKSMSASTLPVTAVRMNPSSDKNRPDCDHESAVWTSIDRGTDGNSGFLKTTYALNMKEVDSFDDSLDINNNPSGSASTSSCQNIKRPNIAWEEIAEFPGMARQGHMCATDKKQEIVTAFGSFRGLKFARYAWQTGCTCFLILMVATRTILAHGGIFITPRTKHTDGATATGGSVFASTTFLTRRSTQLTQLCHFTDRTSRTRGLIGFVGKMIQSTRIAFNTGKTAGIHSRCAFQTFERT